MDDSYIRFDNPLRPQRLDLRGMKAEGHIALSSKRPWTLSLILHGWGVSGHTKGLRPYTLLQLVGCHTRVSSTPGKTGSRSRALRRGAQTPLS